jgi:predicted ATPase
MRRDPPAARRWATETLELVERWNLPWPAGYAAVVLSWVRAIEDDPVDAIPALRGHLARTEAGGTQHQVGWGLGLLAEAHLCNGRPVDALHLLDDALDRVARTGERSYESELHRLRALCLAALSPPRTDQARDALRQAVAVAREQGSAMLVRRAAETCAAITGRRHSGSCDHPDPQP